MNEFENCMFDDMTKCIVNVSIDTIMYSCECKCCSPLLFSLWI